MDSAAVFPAVRTIQGGQAVYIAAVPFSFVSSVRAQKAQEQTGTTHRENRPRQRSAEQIATYLSGPARGLLAPLVAAIDGGLHFEPLDAEQGIRGCGRLSLEIGASIRWVDGEARVAGIARALRLHPALGRETIGLVVMAGMSDEAHQTLAANLNRSRRRGPAKRVESLPPPIDGRRDRDDL